MPNSPVMAIPDGLTVKRDLELEGRAWHPYVRNALLGVLVAVLVVGLLGFFGQPERKSNATTAGARFSVSAPTKLRGGLLFEGRFEVEALEEIADAWLVLDSGWVDGITLNTSIPAPLEEASRDGRIALRLGPVAAGDLHVLHLHFQVNPTTLGRRSQGVQLLDGERQLAVVERDAWVWP